MKLNSQAGYSLLEVMIAAGILAINMAAMTSFYIDSKRVVERAQSMGQKYNLANTIVQDIKAQVEGYQLFFDGSVATENTYLADVNLAMKWNGMEVFDKEDCVYCKGSLGFIVQPYELPGDQVTYRGMYRAIIKYKHDEIDPTGKKSEFLFVSK